MAIPDCCQLPADTLIAQQVLPQFIQQLGCELHETLQAGTGLGHSVLSLGEQLATPGGRHAHGLHMHLHPNCHWVSPLCVLLLAQKQSSWGDPWCHCHNRCTALPTPCLPGVVNCADGQHQWPWNLELGQRWWLLGPGHLSTETTLACRVQPSMAFWGNGVFQADWAALSLAVHPDLWKPCCQSGQ